MGNVPISCCRTKSPKLNRNSSVSSINRRQSNQGEYLSTSNNHHYKANSNQQQLEPAHILQHISEREPDDSETDPSSNPSNRPIFATRSSINNKINRSNTYQNDSYNSNNSTRCRQQSLLFSSNSQDHGYNSTTSTTNLTHLDGLQLTDSFESSSIQQSNQQSQNTNYKSTGGNLGDDYFFNCYNSANKLNTLDGPLVSYQNAHRKKIRNHLSIINQNNRYLNNNRIKASSCSTIFMDGSTISQPELDQTIKCVSLAIYYHIKNRTSDSSVEIFDETIYPLKIPINSDDDHRTDEFSMLDINNHNNEDESQIDSDRGLREPTLGTIYNFVKTLFKAAQLTSEYAITTLVYLERLMTYGEIDLVPRAWRRMFLGAILLSSKVWEDQAVWNVDYAQILEEISVEDINELERQFLELIQFNMNVPSSVYAKYYFHLRTLALKNQLSQDLVQLTMADAKRLEAMSRAYIDDWQASPIHRKASPQLRRYTSLERSRLNGSAKAVLM